MTLKIGEILEDIQEKAGRAPDRAMSLHPDAFTSPELLNLERELIFRKEWLCVGRDDEICEPGEYFTTSIEGVPIVIVRNDSNELGAFVNVCRHRMATITQGRGKTRVLVCPYHAWSYDLDGKLVSTPKMANDGFDRANCKLTALSLEIWQGFIFVNLDGNAESLNKKLEKFTAQVKHYRVDRMNSVWKKSLTWQTNWKVLVENFLEAYHIDTVHRDTLLPYGGFDEVKPLEPGEIYSFYVQEQVEDNPDDPDPIASSVLKENPDLGDFEIRNTFVGCIYPSFLVSISWFGVLWLSLQPTSPGEIHIDWGVVGPVEGLPLNADNYEEYFFPAWINQVNNEDKPRVESIQQAVESGFAGTGPLHATHELTILEFIRYLARKLDVD